VELLQNLVVLSRDVSDALGYHDDPHCCPDKNSDKYADNKSVKHLAGLFLDLLINLFDAVANGRGLVSFAQGLSNFPQLLQAFIRKRVALLDVFTFRHLVSF
jgi:hypothetical protein